VLIAGERRLRAARLAGLTEVPSLILDAGDVETLAIALTENIQRSDLNPIEQAHGYGILRDQFGLTQEEIADRVSKPRSTVANYLRLLSLPAEVQEAVLSGEISMGHARALAGLTHEEVCLIALDKVVRLGLNVRATEELCQRLSEAGSPQEAEGAPGLGTIDPNILALEEALRDHLGTPVRVQPSGRKGGKVIIQYFDLEQLDEILRRMGIRFDS
jgi:ParB family chromosome partitioning protein